MDRAIAIVAIIILLIIGFVRLFREVIRIADKITSANEFLEKFGVYFKSHGEDYQTYAWLIQKSPKVQLEMGGFGYLASFRPPYANYLINNYQIMLNILPQIRKEFEEDSYLRNGRVLNEYGALVQESLLRYLGSLSEDHEIARKQVKNPVIWLTEGVSWVLLFPVSVLNWVGVLGETIVKKIAHNPLFKFIAGILTILSALSTIMTIVVGWDSFVKTVEKIFTP
jgi:hypothetical protein